MLGFVCNLSGDLCSAGDFLGRLELCGKRFKSPVSVPRATRMEPGLERRPRSHRGPSLAGTPSTPSVEGGGDRWPARGVEEFSQGQVSARQTEAENLLGPAGNVGNAMVNTFPKDKISAGRDGNACD